MNAARKPYFAPLTMSTPGRKSVPKSPVVYYTYDRHGDLVEVQAPGQIDLAKAQIAMPIGARR